MYIASKTPNITQYFVHFDKDDSMYRFCIWARINIDNDNWTLSAETDVGNYTYGWYVETGGRTFKQALLAMDGTYLIEKFASRVVLDMKKTSENLFDNYTGSDLTGLEKLMKTSDFKNIDDLMNGLIADGFYGNIIDPLNCIETDYPMRAKTFIRILTEHLFPQIKKELGTNES